METIVETGYWYLPKKARGKVAGQLEISTDGEIRLSLRGFLTKRIDMSLFKQTTVPVILGKVERSLITLSNCYLVGENYNSPLDLQQTWKASFVVFGVHLQEDEKFDKISLAFTYSTSWIGYSGVSFFQEIGPPIKYGFTNEPPKPIKIGLGFGELTLGLTNSFDLRRHNYHIRERGYIEFSPNKPMSLQELMDSLILPLQCLLDFGTNRANYPSDVRVYLRRLERTIAGRSYIPPLKVYFQTNARDEEDDFDVLKFAMLFSLQDLGDNPHSFIVRWFQVYEELRTVVNLYLTSVRNASTSFENQFLNVVQTLEVYHRSRFDNFVIPKDKHRVRMDQILKAVPGEYAHWVKVALASSNEPRLRARISELATKFFHVIEPLIVSVDDFARAITRSRNYLTHFSDGAKRKVPGRDEMDFLKQTGKFVLQACLLSELECTDKNIVRLIQKQRDFNNAIGVAMQLSSKGIKYCRGVEPK